MVAKNDDKHTNVSPFQLNCYGNQPDFSPEIWIILRETKIWDWRYLQGRSDDLNPTDTNSFSIMKQ